MAVSAEIPPELRRVDKYDVLAGIGEGGMARVFRARLRAPGGASKEVALKLIHPHLCREPDFVRMFLDEMRVAMALSHRNIVQTFDAGKTGESYYMVMELMSRGSLARLLRRLGEGERLPLELGLFIATEICSALSYAHTFQQPGASTGGVVHRDVSPGNILLSDQGDVKLADFGVAKAAGRITSSIGGMIKGKLSYMAPEQARGAVGPRSDLFALGAVLYWMVCGAPLRQNPSLDEVRSGGGRVRIPRPDISSGLERLITRCLSRDPSRRPADAEELRRALTVELERVRQAAGGATDPHARLRAFLEGGEALSPPPDGQARRVADAMMEMALAVPTDHGAAPPRAARGGTEISLAIEPATAVEPPLPAPVPTASSRRGPLLAGAAGLLALLVAWATWLLWPAADVGTHMVGARPAVADSAPLPDLTLDAAPVDLPRPDVGPALDLSPPGQRVDLGRASPPRRRRTGHGLLDLNASPWARVYVDGRHLGATPLQGVRLAAGRHLVRLVNPERGLAASFTVHIRRGQTTRKWVRLRPSLGE